ncbi:MAG TPA: TolC family protein [Candidatus Krumholzibacteria bacterium]|nr:TolC family protein [Candidatus Krumholzibacteria bacterium]
MQHLIVWILFAFAAVSPAAAFAADAGTAAPSTLEEYLAIARANNASVASIVAGARASRERVGVAKGYPDPRLLYGYYVSPDVLEGRQEIILQQEIPFPGKRGLRGEIASREASMAERMSDAMVLEVDFEVKMAFYQYLGLTEIARVLGNEADLLRRMRDVAKVRYESGSAEQQDVLKVELTLSRLADETTINRRDIATTRARLNELIGRDAASPLPDPKWSSPDVSMIDRAALSDSALVHRPEIDGARQEMAAAEATRRLAKREFIPDFMLGVNYEFGAGEDDWWELMAGINLPIWIGKRRAMVREAEAMQKSAEYRMREETLRTLSEVEAATVRARAARERLERFENAILPQAEAAFASSEASYRTGRVDFLDYLDSERMLLEMRRDYAMVRADFGMQLAALERAVGLGSVTRE